MVWLLRCDVRRAPAGLGRYRAVRAGLDYLVRADQLELLLSKRSGAGAAAGDPGVQASLGRPSCCSHNASVLQCGAGCCRCECAHARA